jgi:hypothetical protein
MPGGLPHGDRNDVRHDLPTCTQGVAADHVDRDELRMPFISGYASVSGVARGIGETFNAWVSLMADGFRLP